MKLVAGVDIGNSTTEACIAAYSNGKINFLSCSTAATTGIKGTIQNVGGVVHALEEALRKIDRKISALDEIRINEAAPVIGDTAMETITQTIITNSTMIGHNPSTPGGAGLGTGYTVDIAKLNDCSPDKSYIAIASSSLIYEEAARLLNRALTEGIKVNGVIAEKDEGVLICNRLIRKLPVVDEVKDIKKVPLNAYCAVEVAEGGHTVSILSNPYGISTIFKLTPEETKGIVTAAKGLSGLRSAVVIKTPGGAVEDKVIPAGFLYIKGKYSSEIVDVDSGADEIMKVLGKAGEIDDVEGEADTNVGDMINRIKNTMADLTGDEVGDIKIRDILAVDTYLPVKVTGGLAGESFMEKAVAIAAMVRTAKLPMSKVAERLEHQTGVKVRIRGVEAVMAVLGALTTPGVTYPSAVLDLGGGSTDAALLDENGIVRSIHTAGAGELVTMLINSELGLNDRNLAEAIKRYPAAKVESLLHIRMENGEFKYFEAPLSSRYFGRIVVLKEDMVPVPKDISLEKIIEVRRSAKQRVFVQNAIRALKEIAPGKDLKLVGNVVLVGGSALDFEVPEMIMKEFSKYRIVCGRGNIRSSEGPRNAVATGLVMSHVLE